MRKIGLVVVNIAVLAWWLAPWQLHLDLDVYRLGARMWLSGGDLYGLLPPTIIGNHLPFTYPPVAAVLFTPFTLVPFPVAGVVLTALSIAALVLVLVIVRAPVAMVLPVALLLEPVRDTLDFGQVNLLLMALVALDCLVRQPRWPRGVLVGLAAAIKLTPAAFVLFFLLRGDRRAAATALGSFLAVTGIGFALNPTGSVKYWTSTVFNPDRIGGAAFESNQSISGVLARLGVERGPLWLVLAAVVVAVGAVAVRRAPNPVTALALNGFVVLLCSPVSWSHHWVWIVPFLLVARPALAAGGVLLFLPAPHWWWSADDGWTWLTVTVGNAYVWFAIAMLVIQPACRSAGFPSTNRSRPSAKSSATTPS
jgi:alpha-1,2-mannosyltransferase